MKIICFTVADQANMSYAKMMVNSFHKFHPDIEVKIYNEVDVGDPINYYRQKAMFAKELITDYDLVLGLDSDQIITGNLDYIFNQEYDVGCVYNFNRVDAVKFGAIKTLDILPQEYLNCGLVAMRSEKFVNHWWRLCNSYHFGNYQYREQDLMNIMVYYGDYDVCIFDKPNMVEKYHAWHGLASKGEWNKIILKGDDLILPANDKYPECDKEIKVIHFAGGKGEVKMNYKVYFNEEVIKRLDYLVSDVK